MSEFPDVLGMKLEDAESILQLSQTPYRIENVLFYGKNHSEMCIPRIIRQITEDDAICLTVADVRDI